MHVHFRVHGAGKKNLHGDGIALWYTRDRLVPGTLLSAPLWSGPLPIVLRLLPGSALGTRSWWDSEPLLLAIADALPAGPSLWAYDGRSIFGGSGLPPGGTWGMVGCRGRKGRCLPAVALPRYTRIYKVQSKARATQERPRSLPHLPRKPCKEVTEHQEERCGPPSPHLRKPEAAGRAPTSLRARL